MWIPFETFRSNVIADLNAMFLLPRVDPNDPSHPDNLLLQINNSMSGRKSDEVFVTYASWVIDAQGLRIRIKIAAARRDQDGVITVTTEESEVNRVTAASAQIRV